MAKPYVDFSLLIQIRKKNYHIKKQTICTKFYLLKRSDCNHLEALAICEDKTVVILSGNYCKYC